MKRISTLLLFLLTLLTGYAQNPFATYGYKPKMATLSNGRFDEFHDKDRIIEIGSVKFDTKTNKIVGPAESDTLDTVMDIQTVSRFISIDPHAERYYSISPYAYCNNNPISLIDEEGTLGHIVIGAFVGALFELGSQIIDAEGDLSKVKWGKVAIAAVVGGVGAALPTLGGVITTTLGNLVTEALDGHRDAEHMLASIANGLITSLLGVGAGKLAAKVGGRIIAKVLSKQAPGRIKQVITSVMQIAGEDRNAVKDIAWALTKYKTLPEHLFGRSNEQLVNSMVSGVGSTIGSRWIHGN